MIKNLWTKDRKYNYNYRVHFVFDLIDFTQAKSIIDLGCGKQDFLTHLLATNTTYRGEKIEYTGMDLYRHCQSTVVKDFNNGAKIGQKADIILCLGFFAYIYDVKSVIKDIYSNCEIVVASYICPDDYPVTYKQANRYSKEEFKRLFTDERFFMRGLFSYMNPSFRIDTIFIFSKHQDNRFLKNPITSLKQR